MNIYCSQFVTLFTFFVYCSKFCYYSSRRVLHYLLDTLCVPLSPQPSQTTRHKNQSFLYLKSLSLPSSPSSPAQLRHRRQPLQHQLLLSLLHSLLLVHNLLPLSSPRLLLLHHPKRRALQHQHHHHQHRQVHSFSLMFCACFILFWYSLLINYWLISHRQNIWGFSLLSDPTSYLFLFISYLFSISLFFSFFSIFRSNWFSSIDFLLLVVLRSLFRFVSLFAMFHNFTYNLNFIVSMIWNIYFYSMYNGWKKYMFLFD